MCAAMLVLRYLAMAGEDKEEKLSCKDRCPLNLEVRNAIFLQEKLEETLTGVGWRGNPHQ